jgi:CsoR family transcriptional regulator, copper-sensing transcriptional repressor
MPSTHNLPSEAQEAMTARLKRIEGQARGIQKMLEDGRDCVDVLHQLSSVKAAVNALSGEMLETFALYCLQHPDEFTSPEQAVEQAVRAIVRSAR